MKKLLAILMLVTFSLGSISASYAMPAPLQTTTHLKKDGTPDKRFKENKTPKAGAATPAKAAAPAPAKAATPAGPMKKDGTPDMRHTANKTAAPAKAAAPAGPMKKDGTPDMRHKANKTTPPSPKK